MRFLLRSLLVWLMALALPLQGIAAAGMQACGPMHGRMGPVAVAVPAPSHGHALADGRLAHAAQLSHDTHPTHSTHSADLSHSAHPFGADNAHPAAAALSSADQDLPPAGHQCGACAACCPALALPSAVVFAAGPGAGGEVIASAPEHLASFVPPGFERPPRAILA